MLAQGDDPPNDSRTRKKSGPQTDHVREADAPGRRIDRRVESAGRVRPDGHGSKHPTCRLDHRSSLRVGPPRQGRNDRFPQDRSRCPPLGEGADPMTATATKTWEAMRTSESRKVEQ